ncbi:ATP-binding cassette domain-containing protein [Candidatus Mycoplasma mahonii]|uniref:ATP-binding cassette domain-containing protein n=1 Tax=Candidatus Mycoplasma mahonii TaxID=3004105 RepID=UPI0026F2CE65|nr:ATP-binding cassette domain-containing protein [Candidatus Mycoplasma mahonii]WKX02823.1 ATP-binding cassette domain-containing protein [Candidatus Mycoplasma mahonii]
MSFIFNKSSNILFFDSNGSGKSTLSKIISRLDKKYEREVFRDKSTKNNYYQSSFIYQSSSRDFINGNVIKNITSFNEDYDTQRLENIVDMLKIQKITSKNIQKISSGEAVLVKIATVLYSGAKLKIYDELLMNIDTKKRIKVLDIILKQDSINIVIFYSLKKMKLKNLTKYYL